MVTVISKILRRVTRALLLTRSDIKQKYSKLYMHGFPTYVRVGLFFVDFLSSRTYNVYIVHKLYGFYWNCINTTIQNRNVMMTQQQEIEQAVKLATNCLKYQQFLDMHAKRTFRNIQQAYKNKQPISQALLKSVIKHVRRTHRNLQAQTNKT